MRWDRSFQINARGTMLMVRGALPTLLARGGGSIINTSSGATLLGDLFLPAYAASKSAVNTLTKYVAAQYGKANIRCNEIRSEESRVGKECVRTCRISGRRSD